MRTYHFLSGDHALDDISKRRLKLSEIDKLNDPFELWCTAQGDKGLVILNDSDWTAQEIMDRAKALATSAYNEVWSL